MGILFESVWSTYFEIVQLVLTVAPHAVIHVVVLPDDADGFVGVVPVNIVYSIRPQVTINDI